MPGNKKLAELIDYTTVLPYDSEMFGIYQPLIGWKSKRIERRFKQGFEADKRSLLDRLKNQFTGQVDLVYDPDCQVRISIRPGVLDAGKVRTFDSIVLAKIAEELPPFEKLKPDMWPRPDQSRPHRGDLPRVRDTGLRRLLRGAVPRRRQ